MLGTRHNPIGTQTKAMKENDTFVYFVTGYNGTTTAYIPNIDVVATIDWGDGSTSETSGGDSTTSLSHDYTDGVKYHIVRINAPSATKILSSGTEYKSIVRIDNIPKGITSMSDYAYGMSDDSSGLNPLQGADIINGLGLTGTGTSMFQNCRHLTRVVLPKTLTTLGDKTFTYCTKLENIDLPDSLTTISGSSLSNPFWMAGFKKLHFGPNVKAQSYPIAAGCQDVEVLEVDSANTELRSEGNCIINRSSNYVDTLCWHSVVPTSVTTLGAYCGAYLGGTNYQLASHVTTIKEYAFTYADTTTLDFSLCTGLTSFEQYGCAYAKSTSIYFPVAQTEYGDYLCAYTTNLVETWMGGYEFGNYMYYSSSSNKTLTTIHLWPNFTKSTNFNVINANYNVLNNRTALITIKYHGTISQWNSNTSTNTNASATVKIFGKLSSNGSLGYTSGLMGRFYSHWWTGSTVTVSLVS